MLKDIVPGVQMETENDKVSGKSKSQTWSIQEQEIIKSKYGCEILKQNCTLLEAKDTNFPSDAYIVTYIHENKICYDLTRGKRVSIFDMYYDKLGTGKIQDIDWGYGRINPKIWGYKSTEKKKRK